MRTWGRYYVVSSSKMPGENIKLLDNYDNEHMQAHRRTSYATQDEFFSGYAPGSPRRYSYYHEYLKKNIKKEDQGLSIGSGQCVTELRLINEGYRIQCSDIDETYNEEARRLFPGFKFTKLNIITSPFPIKVDYVISLSMLFYFNHDQLLKVFENVAASLKPGGIFITDPSGAEDNAATYIIDKHLCRYDAGLQYFVKKFLLGRDVQLVKESLGYRLSDADIITAAQKAGFTLEDVQRHDYVTELKDRLLLFNRLPDSVVSLFGRPVPYVRFFKFRKA